MIKWNLIIEDCRCNSISIFTSQYIKIEIVENKKNIYINNKNIIGCLDKKQLKHIYFHLIEEENIKKLYEKQTNNIKKIEERIQININLLSEKLIKIPNSSLYFNKKSNKITKNVSYENISIFSNGALISNSDINNLIYKLKNKENNLLILPENTINYTLHKLSDIDINIICDIKDISNINLNYLTIMSFEFFSLKKFPINFFKKIYWNRIIIDQFHELIDGTMKMRVLHLISKFKRKFIWVKSQYFNKFEINFLFQYLDKLLNIKIIKNKEMINFKTFFDYDVFFNYFYINCLFSNYKQDIHNELITMNSYEEHEYKLLRNNEHRKRFSCITTFCDKKSYSIGNLKIKIEEEINNEIDTYKNELTYCTENTELHKVLINKYTNIIIELTDKLHYTLNRLNNFTNEEKQCSICYENDLDFISLTKCLHVFCPCCIKEYLKIKNKCPCCRKIIDYNELYFIKNDNTEIILDSKINKLINILNEKSNEKIVIFCNYNDYLKLINKVINKNNIKSTLNMEDFKNDIINILCIPYGTNLFDIKIDYLIFIHYMEDDFKQQIISSLKTDIKIINFIRKDTIEEDLYIH